MKNNIPLTPVAGSSNVHSRGYDPGTQTLAIQYKDKAGEPTTLYHYQNVSPDDVDKLIHADSFGKALRSLIVSQPDTYPFTQITDEEQEAAADIAREDQTAVDLGKEAA